MMPVPPRRPVRPLYSLACALALALLVGIPAQRVISQGEPASADSPGSAPPAPPAQVPGTSTGSTSPGASSGPDYTAIPLPPNTVSPRNANYTLEARLDPETRIIEGRGVLTWRNLQAASATELPFHLYWNAFRNTGSTWLLEDQLRGRSDLDDPREEDWGWIEVTSMRMASGGEGPASELPRRYVDPDVDDLDGENPADRTVLVATLPSPVGSGETAEVELTWRARVPRTFARTGFRGDFYFLAHWFPKLAVFEPEGWNMHSFHAATEFYSDYGNYDVSLTVPEDWVVGATGRETELASNGDGTATHRYVQEDVHAFTWTTSPDYLVRERRFVVEGLPPVDMRLLIQPEHLDQVDRHFHATAAALEHYGKWYGPYPYGHVTIVDPAYGSGAGGMEYPTIFTSGTGLFRPFGGGSPEGVTIHEAGHQFWYGLVGNNEFEHAWLDEGLNTFSTSRVEDVTYGDSFHYESYLDPPGDDFSGFLRVLFREARESRWVYGNRWHRFHGGTPPSAGPQSEPTYLYLPSEAGSLSYSKSALWLGTLEGYLGWDTLQGILSTFFERYRFRHPRPEDFFAVADEVAGEDLAWFFDQAHRDAVRFDYAVTKVSSKPLEVEGMMDGERKGEPVYRGSSEEDGDEGEEGDNEETLYRTEVVVRRLAPGVFPVEVLLVFEDGSEVRHLWDARREADHPEGVLDRADTYEIYTEVGPSKLAHAVVDPERVLLLDDDYRNNSRLREPEPELPARKWASKWMVWLQDYLTTFTFFS